MKLRGGCLSSEDLNQVIVTLKSTEVPQWQKDKLVQVLRYRRQEQIQPTEASSIRAAILDRRIQELAWLKPIALGEGEMDLPRQLVAEQFPSKGGGPLLAHCFNSNIVHTPEEFLFTKPNKTSPYQCSVVSGADAKVLCAKKVRSSALFRSIKDDELLSLQADVNAGKFNKEFNAYITANPPPTRQTPLSPIVTSPLVLSPMVTTTNTTTSSSSIPMTPINIPSNVVSTTGSGSGRQLTFISSPYNSSNTLYKPVSRKVQEGKNMNTSGL